MARSYLQHFDRLTIWKRNDERAPHKPLLILWAIGRCLQGEDRLVEYAVAHDSLLSLLSAFGPPRRDHKPHEPFWRLQNDHIWEIPDRHRMTEDSRGGVSPAGLREFQIKGGFPKPLFELFRRETTIARNVAHQLVSAHFPKSMQTAVLEATLGERIVFDPWAHDHRPSSDQSELLEYTVKRRKRNSEFRDNVLQLCRRRCAVCEYSIEFPEKYWPALEAAHIKWNSHSGPDEASNGLSFCVLHHELFDWGAFTILPDSLQIAVAPEVVNQSSVVSLTDFDGLELPVKRKNYSDWPAENFLNWHARNVFKDSTFRARR